MLIIICLLFYLKILDQYKISSEIELQSLSLFKNKNKSKRYCEAKKIIDSAYALSKKRDHQWRHMMLCLKVANNETNNYRTCQSLFDFIKLTISPTEKEPIRKLSKSSNVINKSSILKKKVNCTNCVKLLSIHDAGHKANSKDCPSNNVNWINKH